MNAQMLKSQKGFIENGKEHLVCRLKHSLYRLKQAPRSWNFALDKSLKDMVFQQSSNDPCVYIFPRGANSIIIGVYVDDIMICGKSTGCIEEIKEALCNKFKVKDLSELKYFLGVNVHQNHQNGAIWIGQQTYTENMLKKLGFYDAKSISTPLNQSKLN